MCLHSRVINLYRRIVIGLKKKAGQHFHLSLSMIDLDYLIIFGV